MKRNLVVPVLAAITLWSTNASAGVWLELLHAHCFTGSEDDIEEDNGVIGEVPGSIDCFNKDFNGGVSRTVLSIKAFQPWEYGFVFLYYDITGPFNAADSDFGEDDPSNASANERGGFFGGTTLAISPKKIAEKINGKPYDWGLIADVSIKYEMEHVSKFGMLNYYGLHWDLAVPWLDFLSVTTVIRDDRVYKGVDLQLGTAWQKSFSLGSQDFIFGGFLQWGLFGEGESRRDPALGEGNNFITSQPQLLWDFGKAVQFTPAKLYLGFEYQYTMNRYLIEDKSENLLQGMVRWNI
ncbi:MAG TPA: hypothetical protein VK698_36400 [Kofleriaceae bacterium]|nr:hypothetical protein [Kofleriaceae bacterium]